MTDYTVQKHVNTSNSIHKCEIHVEETEFKSPLLFFFSILYLLSLSHPRLTAPPPPPPCRDAFMVWSAPPLSYVSAMVVSIGRRSNDSACRLPLCMFPRWCTPDEEAPLTRNRASEQICDRPEQLPRVRPF